MVPAQVDQRPAEHPAAHGQQAEPGSDKYYVAEQGPSTALRHLKKENKSDLTTTLQSSRHILQLLD